MTDRVFISHADKDSALANARSDLLTGLNLQTSNIFCSSLAGLGIPAGQDFKSYIKQELANSTVVIALLTPNYYASAFCFVGSWRYMGAFQRFFCHSWSLIRTFGEDEGCSAGHASTAA